VRGSEHVAIAVLTTGCALYALNHGQIEMTPPALAIVATAAIGSLVPDIDHPRAWISNRIPITLAGYGLIFLLWFGFSNWYASGLDASAIGAPMWAAMVGFARPFLGGAWLALGLGVALLVLAGVVAAFLEHRGPAHSLGVCAALAFVACIGASVAGQPWTLGLWFGWGYLSHLLADLSTPMGCPALLWPFRSGDLGAIRDVRFPSLTRSMSGGARASVPDNLENAAGTTGTAGPHPIQHSQPTSTSLWTQMADAEADLRPTGGRTPPLESPGVASGTEPSTFDSPAGGASASTRSKACPRCAGALVLRVARRGAHAGSRFYGCANYPKCHYIESVAG